MTAGVVRPLAVFLLLAGCISGQAAEPAQPAKPSGTSTFIRVTADEVVIPIRGPAVTYPTGTSLPLLQENQDDFIVLVPGPEGVRVPAAFPVQTRGTRTGWISSDKSLVLAYRTSSRDGRLYLRKNEHLRPVGQTADSIDVMVERYGREARISIPRTVPGLEVVKESTALAQIASQTAHRPIAPGLSYIPDDFGRIKLVFKPAAAPNLPRLKVTAPGVTVPIGDASVTCYTGDDIALFEQGTNNFIGLVNTEYEGMRLCAFPVQMNGFQTAWVASDKRLIFAYATSSRPGEFLLNEGEILPVIAETPIAYEVLIERFGRWAFLTLPKATPGVERVRPKVVKKPAPPPEPAPVIEKPEPPPPTPVPPPVPEPAETAPVPAEVPQANMADRAKGLLARFFGTGGEQAIPPDGQPIPPADVMQANTEGEEPASLAPAPEPVDTPAADYEEEDESPPGLLVLFFRNRRLMIRVFGGLLVLGTIIYGFSLRAEAKSISAQSAKAEELLLKMVGETSLQQTAAGTALSGSLASMSLGTLAQFLNTDRETGTLTLRDPSNKEIGTMVFMEGEIIDARTKKKRGEQAVYEIFRHPEGSFAFDRGQTSDAARTVTQGTISLLLDAHRVLDEEGPEKKKKVRLKAQ